MATLDAPSSTVAVYDPAATGPMAPPLPARPEYEAATKRKAPLPAEYLRKIVKDHGEMTDAKYKDQRKLYIGAIRYMPFAMLKLVESMPMPWEQAKYVDVVYHVAGAVTIVNERPKVIEPVYTAQWGAMWVAMRNEKKARNGLHRLEEMTFGDLEAPLDYGAHIMDLDAPDAVQLTLDPDDDAAVGDWFYDPQPDLAEHSAGRSNFNKGTWRLGTAALSNLQRLGEVLQTDAVDPNYHYLWDKPSFFTAKALNVALPGGPKFQRPLGEDAKEAARHGAEDDEDWTDFTDLGKVIVRQPLGTEVQLAFPYLYAKTTRNVALAPHRYPSQVAVRGDEDPAAPLFEFPAAYHPIRHVEQPAEMQWPPPSAAVEGEDEELVFDGEEGPLRLPEDFEPFCADIPLEPEDVLAAKDGVALLNASSPYDELSGHMMRPVDCPLLESWYHEHCPRAEPVKIHRSYQNLLKGWVKRRLHPSDRPPGRGGAQRLRIVDQLAETKYFQKTRIEWLEAAMQLSGQGHTMLTLLLRMRNLTFVHIDYNFNARITKVLTTKERKKSRLGQSFHLLRELLKLVKNLTDVHVKFRLAKIDAFQLADAVHYIFTHMAKLTGVYQYKYRVMQQVRRARDLKHLVYHRFNTGGVMKGPGTGFWHPAWRVWVFFLRGMAPLLQRFLGNLLSRLFSGRKIKAEAKRVTRQRIESNLDINLKAALKQAVIEALPEGVQAGRKAQVVEQHANEAFRCWKANIPWVVPEMPPQFKRLIEKFVREKADLYVQQTYYNRTKIEGGETVEKGLYQKNLGRISRLKLRAEQERQAAYLENGSDLDPSHAVAVRQMLARWLQGRGFQPMDFPKMGHKNEKELLAASLNRLREQHNIANRLTQQQREEQVKIEQAFDAPQEALNKIREALARNRIFKPVKVEYMDQYSQLGPVYDIDPEEKFVDAYLDAYLWYEASRRGLFPSWVKPADTECPPMLVHQWANGINSSPQVWQTENGERVVCLQAELEGFYDKVDWTLMRALLKLIMSPVLVDYICSRHDVKLEYKDMAHEHRVGLIRGYQFASFLAQFWGLICDLLMLGETRAAQLAGPPERPNGLFRFAEPHLATAHPVRAYMRYLDRSYFFFRFGRDEGDELVARFLEAEPGPENQTVVGFKNKKCWPRDCRMRLFRHDVNLARAAFWDIRRRVPTAFAEMSWSTSFASVYSESNPNLLFDMAGFEVRILPLARTVGAPPEAENVWCLRDNHTREDTARAHIQVTQEHVARIQNQLRRCLLTIGNATFERIGLKWNGTISQIVAYYREAILGTEGLQEIFVRAESKIQNRVKKVFNSKMPDRFPPVIFYSPRELNGLEMLSVGAALIPAKDMVQSQRTEVGAQYFLKGMTHDDEEFPLPNLIRYYPAWHREFADSERAWAEYYQRSKDAKLNNNRRLTFDELEDILDMGIPRVRTLFNKDRRQLECDRGWRVRQLFSEFQFGRPLRNPWFHPDHDGRLVQGLDEYRKTMLQALGGVEAILEHTLFAGTGCVSWEGLFWEKGSSFEEKKKNQTHLTKAQRGGLAQVPNRRFALWWSPTVNRSSIYAGFETQIDLTGIKMTGKLELIKASLTALFSGHLWTRMHEAVVRDLCEVLSLPDRLDQLNASEVKKEEIHPKKALSLDHSAADLVLFAPTGSTWAVATPSLSTQQQDYFDPARTTTRFWFDVQLKWGDYDRHNIAQYAREKFVEFTTGGGRYPCNTGVVIAMDLAYNCWAAFGYWVPHVKELVTLVMGKVMKNNPSVAGLRHKLKSALNLKSSDPTEAPLTGQNFAELFSDQRIWIVDESNVYVTSAQSTVEGNRKARVENGALTVLNPRTGQLFLTVIHKSTFRGMKRKTKLGRDKAAEEVCTWLRSQPLEERPTRIIATRRTFAPTLSQALVDFPNIGIGKTLLNLPQRLLLEHSRLGELVSAASENKPLRFNVFDDWATSLSPPACFERLILILRCMHVQSERCRAVLQPDRSVMVEPHHFWPTLTVEEWCDVERQLQDIILADYARRNNISVSQLTSTEVRSIILGEEIQSQDLQQEELDAIAKQQKALKGAEGANTGAVMRTVERRNRLGEMITVRTKTFEVGALSATATWRGAALASAQLRARRVERVTLPGQAAAVAEQSDAPVTVVLPKSLLNRTIRVADARASVVGILLGCAVPQDPSIKEVRAILLPPQHAHNTTVAFPTKLPEIPVVGAGSGAVTRTAASEVLEPIGWLRTHASADGEAPPLLPTDLQLLAKFLMDNERLNLLELPMVVVGLGNTESYVQGYSVTEQGMVWALDNKDANPATLAAQELDPDHAVKAFVKVTDRLDGHFLVPAQGSWNYTFRGKVWPQEYAVKADVPRPYHDMVHRPTHFTAFGRDTDADDLDFGVDGADTQDAFN